uniref:hypothetical protein n=1 Tax=Photorhabdus sp. CRCIA-P01 TaxID=2019570 RepID=UPI0030D95076
MAGLAAGRGAGGSLPQGNGLRGEPERQTATLFKAIFVLRPVGDGEFGFGNMMTLSGVMFMWHGFVSVEIHNHNDIT